MRGKIASTNEAVTMNYLLRHWITFLGLALGAVAGYLYYYFVGCASGTCAITSSPVNSTIYGTLLGGVLLNTFEGTFLRNKQNKL